MNRVLKTIGLPLKTKNDDDNHYLITHELVFNTSWGVADSAKIRDLLNEFTTGLNDIYGLALCNITPASEGNTVTLSMVDLKLVTVLPAGSEQKVLIQVSVSGQASGLIQSSAASVSTGSNQGHGIQILVPSSADEQHHSASAEAANQPFAGPSGIIKPSTLIVQTPGSNAPTNATGSMVQPTTQELGKRVAVPPRAHGSPLILQLSSVYTDSDDLPTPKQVALLVARKGGRLSRQVFTHDFDKAYYL